MFVGPIKTILNSFHDFLIFSWEDFRDSRSFASNGLAIFDGKRREIIRWHSVIGVDINLVTEKWRSVLDDGPGDHLRIMNDPLTIILP